MPAPSELVNSATSDKLAEVDWAKNIEICELVANDQRQAKDVIKAIKKRLGNKSGNVQLYAVMLLETLMNNIGDAVHKQVIEAGLLPILVKIVKKKSDLPVRERIFLLLDATQTSLGGASGKFPQYYTAYYELVSAGVKFAQRPRVVSSDHPPPGERQNNLTVANIASLNNEMTAQEENSQPSSGFSIIEKASAAMEVLREVLDAVSTQNPEAAKDEFTLDLVEQCSFQKDRVMHLVMSCRDERLLSQAIELNEELGRILARHEALISHRSPSTESPMELHNESSPLSSHIIQKGRGTWASNHNNHVAQPTSAPNHNNHVAQPTSTPNHVNHVNYDEVEEEEEAEQLSRRIRKGKAHVKPEDEDRVEEKPLGLLASLDHTEMLHRPLIRPLTIEPQSNGVKAPPSGTLIPPPPAKHAEREKFFQEKKGDGATLSGHMRGLSLHSRGGSSSSFSGSICSNE